MYRSAAARAAGVRAANMPGAGATSIDKSQGAAWGGGRAAAGRRHHRVGQVVWSLWLSPGERIARRPARVRRHERGILSGPRYSARRPDAGCSQAVECVQLSVRLECADLPESGHRVGVADVPDQRMRCPRPMCFARRNDRQLSPAGFATTNPCRFCVDHEAASQSTARLGCYPSSSCEPSV